MDARMFGPACRVVLAGRGTTLLDVAITASVLAVATTGLLAGILSSMRLGRINEERAAARNEACRVLSAIRGMPGILEAYQRFGGGGPGETFDVHGLAAPVPGEPVGRVIVWRQKSGDPPDPDSLLPWAPADLQEACGRFQLNFPLALIGNEGFFGQDYLDTNEDGFVDHLDAPSILPVTVRIRWRSHSGVITEYFSTLIGLQ